MLELAGVSRQTFYALYASKLECFLEALDLVGEVIIARMGAALLAPERPPLDQAIDAFAGTWRVIADHPAFARLYVVEFTPPGPGARSAGGTSSNGHQRARRPARQTGSGRQVCV
ncbi:MAG: TetR/AcrR family transcriptional regulator [Candidatus Microthrix sp.]|nr:TetR/AcrR family transcriptional regulator [Candidatus Microthrix sp.]